METLDETTGQGELTLSSKSQQHLANAAKWGKFASIVMIILIGITALFSIYAIFMGMSYRFERMRWLTPLLQTGMYFFMLMAFIKMLTFCGKIQRTLTTKSNADLDVALENLESTHKAWGIFAIISLGLVVLGFIIGLIGVLAGGMRF